MDIAIMLIQVQLVLVQDYFMHRTAYFVLAQAPYETLSEFQICKFTIFWGGTISIQYTNTGISWLDSQAKRFQFHHFQYRHANTEYDRRCGTGGGWVGNEAMARMVK